MSYLARVRHIAEVYFSQTSVLCFTGDLAAVRIIGVSAIAGMSARRELTVLHSA